MGTEQMEAYSEVLEVLNHMDSLYYSKVPTKLMSFFEENKLKSYKEHIDPFIPLGSQNISRKTISILAMLDLKYWCENEEEKQKLIGKYKKNEVENKENLTEKYKAFSMNEEKKIVASEVLTTNLPAKLKSESFWQKFTMQIKKVFMR